MNSLRFTPKVIWAFLSSIRTSFTWYSKMFVSKLYYFMWMLAATLSVFGNVVFAWVSTYFLLGSKSLWTILTDLFFFFPGAMVMMMMMMTVLTCKWFSVNTIAILYLIRLNIFSWVVTDPANNDTVWIRFFLNNWYTLHQDQNSIYI